MKCTGYQHVQRTYPCLQFLQEQTSVERTLGFMLAELEQNFPGKLQWQFYQTRVFPVLTPPSALLLGPLLLPLMMSPLGHLDPPLIKLPSLIDGLFDPGLLDERVAE